MARDLDEKNGLLQLVMPVEVTFYSKLFSENKF